MDLTQWREQTAVMHGEFNRQRFLFASGQVARPDWQSTMVRYAHLFSRDAVAELVANLDQGREWENLLDSVWGLYTKPQMPTLQQALFEAKIGESTWMQAQHALRYEPDRAVRQARWHRLWDVYEDQIAAAQVASLLAQDQRATEVGLTGQLDAYLKLNHVDLDAVLKLGETLLAATDTAYAQVTQQALGCPPTECEAHDVDYLLFARESGAVPLPEEHVESVLHDSLWSMGVDLRAMPGLTIDRENRPGRPDTAGCSFVSPDQILVAQRPTGLWKDLSLLWHEMGHALHFWTAARSQPHEFVWFNRRDTAETHAFFMEQVVEQPGWLERWFGLTVHDAARLRRDLLVKRLVTVRLLTAQAQFEVAWRRNRAAMDPAQYWKSLYRRALGAVVRPASWSWSGVSSILLYSLDYLQGQCAAATLRAQVGKGFWERKETVLHLQTIWSIGTRTNVNELLPLSADALVAEFQELLPSAS